MLYKIHNLKVLLKVRVEVWLLSDMSKARICREGFFKNREGDYEFKVILFELTNSLDTFEENMDDILHPYLLEKKSILCKNIKVYRFWKGGRILMSHHIKGRSRGQT